MKAFKTVLALLILYIFCSTVATIVYVSVWLSGYHSNTTRKIIGRVSVSEGIVTIFDNKQNTALTDLFTRGHMSEVLTNYRSVGEFSGSKIELTYCTIDIKPNLYPLGYTKIVTLCKVLADGNIVYSKNDTPWGILMEKSYLRDIIGQPSEMVIKLPNISNGGVRVVLTETNIITEQE